MMPDSPVRSVKEILDDVAETEAQLKSQLRQQEERVETTRRLVGEMQHIKKRVTINNQDQQEVLIVYLFFHLFLCLIHFVLGISVMLYFCVVPHVRHATPHHHLDRSMDYCRQSNGT